MERENQREALTAVLTRQAVSAVISKKSAGAFEKTIKGMSGDG